MILPDSYIETSKYGGIAIDVYNGSFNLVRAQEGQDGKVYAEWAFPQDKDRQPRDKAVPVGITLADDKDAAVNVLREIATIIRDCKPVEVPEVNRVPKENRGYEHDDDIPF